MFKLFIKQTTRGEGENTLWSSILVSTKRMNNFERNILFFFLVDWNTHCMHTIFSSHSSFSFFFLFRREMIRICMISNSKLKPLSQKNEYLFRYINKALEFWLTKKKRKVLFHSFDRICAHLVWKSFPFQYYFRLPLLKLKWFWFGVVFGRDCQICSLLVFEFPIHLFAPIMWQFCSVMLFSCCCYYFILQIQKRISHSHYIVGRYTHWLLVNVDVEGEKRKISNST